MAQGAVDVETAVGSEPPNPPPNEPCGTVGVNDPVEGGGTDDGGGGVPPLTGAGGADGAGAGGVTENEMI